MMMPTSATPCAIASCKPVSRSKRRHGAPGECDAVNMQFNRALRLARIGQRIVAL